MRHHLDVAELTQTYEAKGVNHFEQEATPPHGQQGGQDPRQPEVSEVCQEQRWQDSGESQEEPTLLAGWALGDQCSPMGIPSTRPLPYCWGGIGDICPWSVSVKTSVPE